MAIDQITTGVIKDNAVTAAKIPAGAVDADVGTGAITTAKLAADAVDGTKLADNAVNSEHVTNGSIDLAHLSADSVDGTKIADDAINSEHYAAGSIDTAHIGNDQVTGAKIENNPTIAGNLTVTGDVIPSTPLSHRNMIINGSMQVSQRGTSATGKTTNGYYVPDRFQIRITNNGTWTISKNTIAVTEGNRHTVKLQCTSTGSSGDTGRNLAIWYSFEGADVQVLQKGTANAKKLTLSFWIRAYEAGNYRVNLHDSDNDRLVGGTYTISASNTWEKKTITFAADTTGGNLNDDFNESLRVQWWFDSGSSYTGGTAPTAWEARASADENAGGHTTGDDSTNNFFELTGVQLELGENATPFEWRSYADELARCQRYYVAFGNGTNGAAANLHTGAASGTGTVYFNYWLPVQPRAQPTLSISGQVRISDNYVADHLATPPSIVDAVVDSSMGGRIRLGGFSSLTVGRTYGSAATSGTGKMKWDMEL